MHSIQVRTQKTAMQATSLHAFYQSLPAERRRAYDREWSSFLTVTGRDIRSLNSITKADCIRYAESLAARYKNGSVNVKLYSVSKILNLCKSDGLIRENVITDTMKVKRLTLPTEKKVRTWITAKDIEKATRKENRTSLIIRTLANTGLRISELCDIERKNCTIEGEYVRLFVIGKGKKERHVTITAALYQRIALIFTAESKYLFHSKRGKRLSRNNIYKQIASAFKAAIGRKVNPHMMRHYNATALIEKGYDVHSVAAHLSHSSAAITLDMYTHTELTPEQLVLIA